MVSRWDDPETRAKKRNGPPCETCRPRLDPANLEITRVYEQCAGQWIMGFSGAVDINIPAVKIVMDLEGVTDQRRVLNGVRTLAREQIRKWNEEKPKGSNKGGD